MSVSDMDSSNMRALACLRQSLNRVKSLLTLLIEEIVLARLKAALEKVQYSSGINCTIDEEDEFVPWLP